MNSKPAVEVKSDMYTHKSFDLVNYVLGDVPVEAVDLPEAAGPAAVEPSTSELVLPARRPTAVAMISNKRKLSARITDRFSPYMLNHLHQSGVLKRLENEAVELPYHENMARIRPQTAKSESDRAQRDRNNVASRQTRLKIKLLEEELLKESRNVEEENRRQKIKSAMYRAYINKLMEMCRVNNMNVDMDIDAEWAKVSGR